MPTIYPTGNQRKGLLVAHGIKLADIAEATHVEPSHVSRIIRGERGTRRTAQTVRVMEYVANRLGCPVNQLWPDDTASAA